MSLESKIEELTEAVTTLTGALATLTTQNLQATTKVTAGEIVKDEKVIEFSEPSETPAEKKKREAKEKRDAKRQAAIDKETAEAEEPEPEVEPEVKEAEEVKEVTVLMLRKVASYIIAQGKKPLWHKALKATGAKKLSEVEDRAALLTVIEKIAGKTHDECPDA